MPKIDPFATCPELKKSILFPMRHAMKIVESRFERIDYSLAGITVLQFYVLLICNHRTINQGTLGQCLGLNKNAMVKLGDDMEDLGLVTKTRNPENRKEVLIAATAKGKHAFDTVFSHQKETVLEAFFPLTQTEVKRIWDWSIEISETFHKSSKK